MIRHVTNPSECTSAERCILAYLFDLYTSCGMLKAKIPASEPFFVAYPKIKQMLCAQQQPIATIHPYEEQFMKEILDSPRRGGKIDPAWARQLTESSVNRYSFVCNALIAVSRETDNDRLNDLSIMCAELTASCNALSAEWLGAFIALCGSSNETFYTDLLDKIDVNDVNLHNALAVFTCILVGKYILHSNH